MTKIKRISGMVLGILFIGLCVSFLRLSQFGVDPFSAMNLGISGFIGWSFGTWQLLAQLMASMGVALYMVADMGIAPYDSVAIIIEKLTHQKIPFHKARILSDVVVVIIGIIFATASGAGIWSVVGIGTIINACFNGPLIQFFKTKLERFYL